MPTPLRFLESGMQDGDVIIARGRSWISWFIRVWTQSPFAHVGMITWSRPGVDMIPSDAPVLCVIEARLGRPVTMRPLEQAIHEDGPVHWYRLHDRVATLADGDALPAHRVHYRDVDRRRITDAARKHLGRPYASWFQFLRSFGGLSPRLADRMRLPSDVDAAGVFCSELVTDALRNGGMEWSEHQDPARMSPGDVALLPFFARKATVTL